MNTCFVLPQHAIKVFFLWKNLEIKHEHQLHIRYVYFVARTTLMIRSEANNEVAGEYPYLLQKQ